MPRRPPPPPQEEQHALALVKQATLLPEVMFIPSAEQRELKAKFWIEFRANPIADDADVTPALVEEILGHSIAGWLRQKHFWQWWSARDITKRYLEVGAEKAVEMALMYLDPAVPMQDSARVNLIKLVLEYAGKTPPVRKEIKWADRDIADLSDEQLDALIEKLSRKKLKPVQQELTEG